MSNEIQGVITHVKHVGTSTMGNPTYQIEIRDDSKMNTSEPIYQSLRTMSNTMFAYACDNPEYREHVHIFTLTKAGRIRSARRA